MDQIDTPAQTPPMFDHVTTGVTAPVDAQRGSAGRRIGLGVGVLALAAASAFGGYTVASGETKDAEDALAAVSTDLESANDEVDDATQRIAELEADAADALADLEAATDETRSASAERDQARDDLNAIALISRDELREYGDRVVEIWAQMEAAESSTDLQSIFLTTDRSLNQVVGSNVAPEDVECKQIIVNNGFATAILVASSVLGVLEEGTPEDVVALKAELEGSAEAIRVVLDDACS